MPKRSQNLILNPIINKPKPIQPIEFKRSVQHGTVSVKRGYVTMSSQIPGSHVSTYIIVLNAKPKGCPSVTRSFSALNLRILHLHLLLCPLQSPLSLPHSNHLQNLLHLSLQVVCRPSLYNQLSKIFHLEHF